VPPQRPATQPGKNGAAEAPTRLPKRMAPPAQRCLHHLFEKGLPPGAARGDCRGGGPALGGIAEADQVEAIDATSPAAAATRRAAPVAACHRPKTVNQQAGRMAGFPSCRKWQAIPATAKPQCSAPRCRTRCDSWPRRVVTTGRSDARRKHYSRSSSDPVVAVRRTRRFFQGHSRRRGSGVLSRPPSLAARPLRVLDLMAGFHSRHSRPLPLTHRPGKPAASGVGP